MASRTFNCSECGKPAVESGDGQPLGLVPQSICDDCMPAYEKGTKGRAVAAAEAAVAEAQAALANARSDLTAAQAMPATTMVVGHDVPGRPDAPFTVAELKELADRHGIDLGDSTRKADIRAKVIDGLKVADLRTFAADEGIELHGANSREEIKAQLTAVGEPEPTETTGSFTTVSGSPSTETTGTFTSFSSPTPGDSDEGE